MDGQGPPHSTGGYPRLAAGHPPMSKCDPISGHGCLALGPARAGLRTMRPTVERYIVDRAAIAAEAEAYFRHPRFDEAVARYAAAGMDPAFGGSPPGEARL